MRLDKWLWAARFFKTRSLASAAVVAGKVRWNGDVTKPAREIKPGDRLRISAGDQVWEVAVQGLCEQRRPAPEARTLYAETPESLELRVKASELRRLAPTPGADLKGRPSKRAGRLIRGFNSG